MKFGPRCTLLLALAGGCTAVTAQEAANTANTATAAATSTAAPAAPAHADAVEAGRRLYVNSCQRCHGIRLVSFGLGFDLRNFPQQDKPRFIRAVSKGLRAMPAWEGTLKPEQMDLIWTYVGSVNGWKPEGAPQ